jgi:hypothetical protein
MRREKEVAGQVRDLEGGLGVAKVKPASNSNSLTCCRARPLLGAVATGPEQTAEQNGHRQGHTMCELGDRYCSLQQSTVRS